MFSSLFSKPASAEERRIRAWCRKTLGITPKNLPLYRQALRHRSARSGNGADLDDNERLEFLGDAVLDTVVGQFVYQQYADQGEGFLTRMRSKLVSRHQLSILAKKVEIEQVMEVKIGHGQHTSVPGNAMEALVGALFLDKGFERTRTAVIKLITTHFDLKVVEQEDRDSKSRLLEWGQKQRRKVVFVLREEHDHGRGKQFVAEVHVDGKAAGSGTGHSKKRAEQEAARDASRNLRLPGVAKPDPITERPSPAGAAAPHRRRKPKQAGKARGPVARPKPASEGATE
ncbi:MAG: ribonuclease III [Flavobacteriales bacterium]|nr:ribonuclease III [Flavobacteriales bacterium]